MKVTYESNIGLSGILDIPCDAPLMTGTPSVPKTVASSNALNEIGNMKIVYIDTETTGFSLDKDQICQIAAFNGDTSYDAHVVPTVPIKSMAALKTGLSVKKGSLYCRGEKLNCVSRESAVKGLLDYLKTFKLNAQNPKIILVGHNVIKFDAERIEKLLTQFQLYDEFLNIVYGYADTVEVFKKKLPERVKQKLSFAEEALVKEYLPQENTANLHDALHDIKTLKHLVDSVKISNQDIIQNCKSTSQIKEAQTILQRRKIQKLAIENNKQQLKVLQDVVKSNIIYKMAKEGITEEVLKTAYSKDKKDGVKVLLSMSQSRDGNDASQQTAALVEDLQYPQNIQKILQKIIEPMPMPMDIEAECELNTDTV
ncbi:uncharacterized protein LOC131670281 [Phymastichus coffea]|uniref:uncharacterized protein LOC131670281 n=1 Tax=Phymastichus coffea TaxID=108790 RepID=UPI00273CE242|nr:uncharacterized protein LOC131670281 [Phymastichus coffea]